MIVDGVIKGVQIKRGNPVDRLLRHYYACVHNADIIGMYVSRMPASEDTVKLIDRMIQSKYPYLGNTEAQRLDEVAKYNKGMAAASKYIKLLSGKKD